MTQMEYLNYLRYWGKTNKSNKDITPLIIYWHTIALMLLPVVIT